MGPHSPGADAAAMRLPGVAGAESPTRPLGLPGVRAGGATTRARVRTRRDAAVLRRATRRRRTGREIPLVPDGAVDHARAHDVEPTGEPVPGEDHAAIVDVGIVELDRADRRVRGRRRHLEGDFPRPPWIAD